MLFFSSNTVFQKLVFEFTEKFGVDKVLHIYITWNIFQQIWKFISPINNERAAGVQVFCLKRLQVLGEESGKAE